MGVELAMSSSAIDQLVQTIMTEHKTENVVVRYVGSRSYEVTTGNEKAVGRSVYTALRNLDNVCRAARGEEL
jgi:hypothetical protein